MSPELLVPAVAAAIAAAAVGLVPWTANPMFTVRALTGVAVGVALTIMAALSLVVVGFAAQAGLLQPLLESCPLIPARHEIPAWQALVSLVSLGTVGSRVWAVHRRWHTADLGTEGARFRVLDDARMIAVAVPGDPGCVVVSRGLLEVLGPRERQVVFAHERAHLRLGHHRYLRAVSLAAAAVPPLSAIASRVRTATERSADEAAVDALGGDRHTVAQTIVRVAGGDVGNAGVLPAFGGGTVEIRVRALLGDAQRPILGLGAAAALAASTAVVLGASALQFHHLTEVVLHVCGW